MQFVIGDEFLEKFLNIKMLKFKDASTLNELFKVRRLYLYVIVVLNDFNIIIFFLIKDIITSFTSFKGIV